jgi:hypothetical protein
VELNITKAIWVGFDLGDDFESVLAIVVRTEECEDGYLYGLQFKGMDNRLYGRLKDYVDGIAYNEEILTIQSQDDAGGQSGS